MNSAGVQGRVSAVRASLGGYHGGRASASASPDAARLAQVKDETCTFMVGLEPRMGVQRMIDMLNERDRLMVRLGLKSVHTDLKGAP